jgi:hypothetical protein
VSEGFQRNHTELISIYFSIHDAYDVLTPEFRPFSIKKASYKNSWFQIEAERADYWNDVLSIILYIFIMRF